MNFYAHSTEKEDKSDWQSLLDHLNSVGNMSAGFAEVFGAWSMAEAQGKLHDLGKYTIPYQHRLEGGRKVDHATWGAKIVLERYGQAGLLPAYAIAGHHAGLANGSNGLSRTALDERLNKDDLPELLNDWQRELALPEKLTFPDKFEVRSDRGAFQLTVLGRMLFSCLVDADFIDTDEFYRKIEGEGPRRTEPLPTLQVLREYLDQRLEHFNADTELNRLRAEILTHVRSHADYRPGLFSLTVPTGGGKTLASLAFALDHAIKHGLQRVIYVIPFTSIVEQTAQVFRAAFGALGDNAVLEHHCAFEEDPKTAWESRDKRRLGMENWDAPIVVTTAVQFFESLFAARPSRCRKLHNIAGSVVILDEAQTLPLKFLQPCVAMLDELALNYRSSIVLCTATQPALRKEDGFNNGFAQLRELAPEPPKLYEKLRRVSVHYIGSLDDAAVAELILSRDQVLCIVNNRRHARALYEAIADQPGAMHLSTLMHARHRRQVLADVRLLLKDGKPCRLVSTSLIEAGVDVDFETVLRAEAGLDSIAQAAGRCNREGKRSRESSQVLVFACPDWAPPPELKQATQAFQTILRKMKSEEQDDLLSLDAVRSYFQELYWQKGDEDLDSHDLLGLLRGSKPTSLPFETLALKFRMIENVMKPVIVPFDPYTGQIDPDAEKALRDLEYAPSIARKLQAFTVQVPKIAFDAMRVAGAISPVAAERYGELFMRLENSDLYHRDFGLHWDNPAFISAERCVW